MYTTMALIVLWTSFSWRLTSSRCSQFIVPQSDGTLKHVPYNSQGDIIVDFAQVGYKHGEESLPRAAVVKTVRPLATGASDVGNIQAAINSMADVPVGANGLRGALLLSAGEFNIDSTIFLNISGVVLRGAGQNRTVLYGSAPRVYSLIVAGRETARSEFSGKSHEVAGYIAVGSKLIPLANAPAVLKVGGRVAIYARKNAQWLNQTGMDKLSHHAPANRTALDWKPFASRHDRTVVKVNADSFVVDVPLVEALDPAYGGGYIRKFSLADSVDHVGVEDLCAYSYFNKSVLASYSARNATKYYADELHASHLLIMYGVVDGFARRICGRHFDHFVSVRKLSKRITISQAAYTEPVSVLDGGRRYPFHLSEANEILFENCYSHSARHAFVLSARTTGPNVFYKCKSEADFASSEPHERWSVGCLYDNCVGSLAIQNRLYYGTGHGWGGANFVAWNTEGTLTLHSPVTDWNFAVGHVGIKSEPVFGHIAGAHSRSWEMHGKHVQPKSLFLAQRASRKITQRRSHKPIQ